MGQVWQATDTQLNRQVALKILPDTFAADPDRLARFTREAQILASLNHPRRAFLTQCAPWRPVIPLWAQWRPVVRVWGEPNPLVEGASEVGRRGGSNIVYRHRWDGEVCRALRHETRFCSVVGDAVRPQPDVLDVIEPLSVGATGTPVASTSSFLTRT